LLSGRDHIEQGVRSCLGILRLARQHPAERLEAACRWALSAGAQSSGFVEQLLKSRRRALPGERDPSSVPLALSNLAKLIARRSSINSFR
jgi:hypothetical protein